MCFHIYFGASPLRFLISLFFSLLRQFTPLNYAINYTIDWVLTVLFAFYTNKYFVFHAEHHSHREFWHQLITFFGGRFVTFLIGIAILATGIQLLGFQSGFGQDMVNIFQNIVVIIVNYFWSVMISFRNQSS